MMRSEAARRIAVALDTPGLSAAMEIVHALRGRVGMFKVGLELFCSAGPDAVREVIRAGCEVFLDLKFHDIPETVSRAVAAVAGLGASLIDVHAAGGHEMMVAARGSVERARSEGRLASVPRVIAVTVLTSREVAPAGASSTAVELARGAKNAGLAGVVASPLEARAVKAACGGDFLVVTPGIRPAWAALNDQKRVATPARALANGADLLVIGRPITAAARPLDALERILDEIEAGTGQGDLARSREAGDATH